MNVHFGFPHSYDAGGGMVTCAPAGLVALTAGIVGAAILGRLVEEGREKRENGQQKHADAPIARVNA